MKSLNLQKEILPLKTVDGRLLRLNKEYLNEFIDELEMFISGQEFMNSRAFSKKVMFTHELKANNTVEGINDSISLIEKVIENAKSVPDQQKKDRIINLYKGYNYILGRRKITEENVLELYKILSKDLLSKEDLACMGDKYRNAPVYILLNGRLDNSMDEGIDYHLIDSYMDEYFKYIYKREHFQTKTDYFIKSQIMHFYFVYIHPFFDINGRTSRTIAMWYLLNCRIYPYIIFNRGINYDADYDKLIRECKNSHNLTKFIKYMLITVKKELEKEYISHYLNEFVTREWSAVDYQTIEYILSMNRNRTVLDFTDFYNHFNDKKRSKEILETMIEPLILDGTIEIVRETKKDMFLEHPNLEFRFNTKRINDIDTEMIKRIKL